MTTGTQHRLTLSEDELLVATDRLGIGDLPTVLAVRNRHATVEATTVARARASRDLVSRKLIVDGAVHPDLDAMLQVLHRPEREVAMRLVTPDGTSRVSVVRRGSLGVLARRVGDDVTVRILVHENVIADVAAVLLSELPPAKAAEISTVGAPLPELSERLSGTRSARELSDRIRAAGAEPKAALLLGTALATRQAFAEIVFYALDDEDGRIRRGPGAVAVFYTAKGRIVGAPSVSPSGQLWVTLKPGSDHVFTQAVGQLVAAAGQRWEAAGSQEVV
ncbi:ESX secretion-associated protein EspG [Mycolicibacterium sp.]|uniref:ESX secretion-associated protein EspG n=1 Tax=Mycolicibacterium sp. TaxID=2320850 RepID=UPI003D12F551